MRCADSAPATGHGNCAAKGGAMGSQHSAREPAPPGTTRRIAVGFTTCNAAPWRVGVCLHRENLLKPGSEHEDSSEFSRDRHTHLMACVSITLLSLSLSLSLSLTLSRLTIARQRKCGLHAWGQVRAEDLEVDLHEL